MSNDQRAWHTWVAAYAIDCPVTWPSMRSMEATSCCLDVTSDSEFSLEAEEGDVKIWCQVWNQSDYWIHHGHKSKKLTSRRSRPFRKPSSGESGSPSSSSYRQRRKKLEVKLYPGAAFHRLARILNRTISRPQWPWRRSKGEQVTYSGSSQS